MVKVLYSAFRWTLGGSSGGMGIEVFRGVRARLDEKSKAKKNFTS